MNKQTFTSTKLICLGVLAILVALLPILPSWAQGMPTQPNKVVLSAPHHQGPTDPQELEAFLDAIFAEQMEKLHVPGAVFVLVKDGQIFFAKGYGFADIENQTPMVPDKTIFHGGSVSRLFTATAVMQLAERRLLNLDDDVNKHLNLFQLEDNYLQPVTVANLLTHTGGFEHRGIGSAARSESKVVPLGEYLASGVLHRVMSPGEVIIYSSPGIALAGYLVEEVSGVPFAQYIDENIFQSLGMSRSSLQQPPPSHLALDLAVGYRYDNGTYKPYPTDYLTNIPPAGDFYFTATDIARFMITHLQNGRYGNTRILEEATTREMHRQHFTNHPRLRGRAYGFSEWFENDQRAIFHDGSAPGFDSRLFLLPDQNMGFLLAYNSNQYLLRADLTSQFLDHYYPVQDQPVASQPSADFQSRVDRFAGGYRSYDYSLHTIEKLLTLFDQIHVTAGGDGTLAVGSSLYVEVESLLFQRVDGEGYVAFREDDNGHITHMFIGTGTFEKLPWYETVAFQQTLIGFFVLVLLSACIAWPIGYLFRKQPSQSTRSSRLARLLAGLTSGLNLMFLIGLALALFLIDQWEFTYGMPPVVIALLFIPLLTAILTVGLLVFAVLAWTDNYWSVLGRLHYSLVALAALVFIWFVNYWNLLGFRF